jgi:hypothetical protein
VIEADIIPAGTRIVCPSCAKQVATLAFSVRMGHTLGLDAFKFAPDQRRGLKQDASCRLCNTGYMVTDITLSGDHLTRMHTEHGWL